METNHLEDVATFIREHRSNEENFEKLYHKLNDEINSKDHKEKYVNLLQQVKEKPAEEYKKAKETNTTAWPEFEKFVSDFEKAVIQAK